jgi:hypothetical protein
MSNLATINFYGDEIIAFKDEKTEKVFVNIRGICETLGLSFSSQRIKLTSDPSYAEALNRVDIDTIKGERESLFLDSDYLQGWLFSIQTNRLKPEIREKHIRYKKECFKVPNDYFAYSAHMSEQVIFMLTLHNEL